MLAFYLFKDDIINHTENYTKIIKMLHGISSAVSINIILLESIDDYPITPDNVTYAHCLECDINPINHLVDYFQSRTVYPHHYKIIVYY